MQNRIDQLDGFRALAIIMVAISHYTSRFPDFYPYGDTLYVYLNLGNLGVKFFFMISGFVIAITLQNTKTARAFAVNRFARLYPALIFCSILTFVVVRIIDTPFTEFRRFPVEGFLSSWTFIPPHFWTEIGIRSPYIDGVYWSLWVEVKFYIIATLIAFFLCRGRDFPIVFSLLVLAASLAGGLAAAFELELLHAILSEVFFLQYAPLFALGALLHGLDQSLSKVRFALILTCLPLLWIWNSPQDFLVLLGFLGLFFLLVFRPGTLWIFSTAPMRLMGLCSYSFYLLHQNIGVALISTWPEGLPNALYALGVLGVFGVIVLLSYLTYVIIETPFRRKIRGWFARGSA